MLRCSCEVGEQWRRMGAAWEWDVARLFAGGGARVRAEDVTWEWGVAWRSGAAWQGVAWQGRA